MIGKHPMVKWREVCAGDYEPIPPYGVKTGAEPRGSGVFVVDLDSPEAISEFEELGGSEETYTVESARGAHLYFVHPGFRVGNSTSELAKGIDIRGDGGMAVGPGAIHRSGHVYRIVNDLAPSPAPDWLLAWLRARPVTELQPQMDAITDPEKLAWHTECYVRYLRETPLVRSEANRGQGDANLFKIVQEGVYHMRLPVPLVHDLIEEHYDPRNDRPWGEQLAERVAHKAKDALARSTVPRCPPPPRGFAQSTQQDSPQAERPRVELVEKPNPIRWGAWDEPVAPVKWRIQNLVPFSTVGGFVAHGSSLKTWTALSLGAAVALGEPWLGRYSTIKGRVIFLDYESGMYELHRRVKMLDGRAVPGLGAWYDPPRLDDDDLWAKLADEKDVGLVLADSLAAGTLGVDENDKDAARALNYAGLYTEKTGASVCFIHHSKKDDGGDSRKAVRGSTAIFAAMDWCYAFRSLEEDGESRRMQIECIKASMGPKPLPVPIELTDKGLIYLPSSNDQDEAPKEKTVEDVQKAIKRVLQGGPIVTKALIFRAISMNTPKGRSLAKDALEALIASGVVYKGHAGFMMS
jgi:hypothetical protein